MFNGTRRFLGICTLLLVAGCAVAPPQPPLPPANDLFSDASFKRPAKPVDTSRLFALTEPMKAYVRSPYFSSAIRNAGKDHGLVDALYKKGELKLEYDAASTRDAGATFAAKTGNCLSLVIMTAAFAKELGLDITFQNVMVDQQWSRSGTMYFASTHVNLSVMTRPESHLRTYEAIKRALTIDFMPPQDTSKLITHPLDEETIVAMFLNNRAAEEMAANRLDEAYWYARAAVEKSPTFITAYNTLGVVYQRHGNYEQAERVYRRALDREREDTMVMHNLIPVLKQLGKKDEADAMAKRLASIEPTPPFYYFQKGMKAMEAKQYAEAKTMFAREVKRSPYYHEFHFWLAIAHWYLGEGKQARESMMAAVDSSTSIDASKRYNGKLAYLNSLVTPSRKRAN